MKHCPNHCNIIASLKDKFCYTCGVKLVPLRKCFCGNELNDCEKFCPSCGKEVL